MASPAATAQRTTVRQALTWALAGALCVAALTAIAAILSGGFDDTDARVIGTSLAFAVFSATAASGAALRFRASESLRSLGLVTIGLSALAFGFSLIAIWVEEADELWQWFGSTAVAALAASHASLVQGAARPTDPPAVAWLTSASIALAVTDAFFGILAISGAVEEVSEGFGQFVGVLVVLLLLTTALPPILRRLQRPSARPGAAAATLSAEVLAAADRIEALNAEPGSRASDIRRECERLRELARRYER